MNNFEFIRYKSTPTDQYTKALATVRIDRKYVVTYAEKALKTGGTFWATASHTITENGEKTHEQSFYLDSRSDEKMLLEFIRSHVMAERKKESAASQAQPVHYPHGLCQPQAPAPVQPDFFAGVGESQEQVPF
jgi:hypothetical protein